MHCRHYYDMDLLRDRHVAVRDIHVLLRYRDRQVLRGIVADRAAETHFRFDNVRPPIRSTVHSHRFLLHLRQFQTERPGES